MELEGRRKAHGATGVVRGQGRWDHKTTDLQRSETRDLRCGSPGVLQSRSTAVSAQQDRGRRRGWAIKSRGGDSGEGQGWSWELTR